MMTIRRWRKKRLILLLVPTVVLLVVNMRTLFSIQQCDESIADMEAQLKRVALTKKQDKEFLLKDRELYQLVANMSDLFNQSALPDKSGEYVVIENLVASHEWTLQEKRDVTLATQCTSNNLHYLIELSKRWQGPVSVAVFTYDEDFLYTISTIFYLRFCHSSVAKHVTFHLSYPKSHAPVHPSSLVRVAQRRLVCSKWPKHGTDQIVKNYQIANGTEYPINMLRSLSTKKTTTTHVFLVDVDLMPSGKLRSSFIQSIQHRSLNGSSNSTNDSTSASAKLTAYIVPVFEIKKGLDAPWTKLDLLKAWARQAVRPFQWTRCFSVCQEPTDYKRWMALPQSQSLQVAYNVSYKPRYEPYFIGERSSLPLFDERFRQYGANRLSQACEMYVAGYEFVVFNNAFLVHDGFKDGSSDRHPSWEEEMKKNQVLYEEFQSDLKENYPGIHRNCSRV